MSADLNKTKKQLAAELEAARQELNALKLERGERKGVEEDLRESEEKYRSVVEDSPGFFCQFQPEYIISFVNKAYRDQFEKTVEELIGSNFLDLIPEDDRALVQSNISSLTPEQPIVTLEYRVLLPGGGVSWQKWTNRIIFNDQGRVKTYLSFGEDITVRKRAEEALRESEAKFSALSKATFEAIFISEKGVCIEANDAASEMFGYSNIEFIGIFGTDVIAPESKEVVKAHMLAGYEEPYEAVAVRKDGSKFPAEFRGRMFNYKGRLTRATSVRDLTERKRAEEALRKSEGLLRGLFDTMLSGVAVYDVRNEGAKGSDYIVKDFNATSLKIEGKFKEEVVGKSLFDLRPTIDEYGLIPIFQEVWRTGNPATFPSAQYIDEHYTNWYENRVFKLPTGEIVAIYDDVTERKQAEEALQKSHEQFITVLNSIPADVYVADMKTYEILFANKHMEENFDASLVGKTCWKAFRNESVPCPHCTNGMLVDSEGNPTEVVVWEGQNPITGKWYINYDRAIRWTDGRLVRIQIATDITERKQAEQELVEARKTAESASLSKSEFLANMSHEIRTPLNGVLGMLQVLQTTPLSANQTECLDTALNSGRSLIRVIGDILDLSRIESGKMDIRQEEVEVDMLMRSIQGAFMNEAARKGLNVHYHIDMLPFPIMGDSGRLRQIFFNLVGNAIKFTEQGEVNVRASFEELEGDSGCFGLYLEVSDTGLGIPKDKLELIFEPFTQADGSHTRKYGGSGLGLAIVKRLVGLMGGSVWIESEEGVGTTVRLKVPAQVVEGEKATRQAPSIVQAVFSSPLKILLAEDDLSNQLVARRLLEKQGHAVTCVGTGQGALEAIKDHRFDLIFMDVQMPEMDGIEATMEIRKDERFKELPIIALTAHAMTGDKERFLEAGMDDYLAKPIEADELAAVIGRVMKKRGSE